MHHTITCTDVAWYSQTWMCILLVSVLFGVSITIKCVVETRQYLEIEAHRRYIYIRAQNASRREFKSMMRTRHFSYHEKKHTLVSEQHDKRRESHADGRYERSRQKANNVLTLNRNKLWPSKYIAVYDPSLDPAKYTHTLNANTDYPLYRQFKNTIVSRNMNPHRDKQCLPEHAQLKRKQS